MRFDSFLRNLKMIFLIWITQPHWKISSCFDFYTHYQRDMLSFLPYVPSAGLTSLPGPRFSTLHLKCHPRKAEPIPPTRVPYPVLSSSRHLPLSKVIYLSVPAFIARPLPPDRFRPSCSLFHSHPTPPHPPTNIPRRPKYSINIC